MPYARRNLKKKGIKVSLKQNNKLKFRKVSFGSQEVQKVWDNKKTLRQNYERLGLIANPSDIMTAKAPENPVIQFIETATVKKDVIIMSCHEQTYMKKLMEKHGDDYDAMFHDRKLNKEQFNANQLERKCIKYAQFMEKYNTPAAANDENENENENENEDEGLLEFCLCLQQTTLFKEALVIFLSSRKHGGYQNHLHQ